MANINLYLDKIESLLKDNLFTKFSGDRQQIIAILDDIREQLPVVIEEAERLIRDRDFIISQARTQAESYIETAQLQARNMVSESSIIRDAKEQAAAMMSDTRQQARRAVEEADRFYKETIASAKMQAENMLREATTKSTAMIAEATERADTLQHVSESAAYERVESAKHNAHRILTSAIDSSTKMLSESERIMSAYLEQTRHQLKQLDMYKKSN